MPMKWSGNMLIRKLLRTAWSYKAQFISMVLMTAIGIGIFLGFNIEWHSIESDTEYFFNETKYADFRAYCDTGFTGEDIERILATDKIDAATRYLSVNTEVLGSDKTIDLNVSENYSVSTMLVTSGKEYDEESDGIWLSDLFAEKNNIRLGNTLTLTYNGAKISGEVVGLIKSGENMICVGDSNQLMPDYSTHGFAYISPKKLENAIGTAFYPQVNIITDMGNSELKESLGAALGKTVQIMGKELHTAYSGSQGEIEEGKAMGAILPVLFLAIAILTMVTTMHRIAAAEKVQIGTLKALGFRDARILRHYCSYGLFIGIVGSALGVALGYWIASLIISPDGMMGTYLDLPDWSLTMPSFCIPVIILTIAFLTLISFLSVRKMLVGSAAEALRAYSPKAMKQSGIEKGRLWKRLHFAAKWNIRDILRHKARTVMTVFGIFGCMLLLIGATGMQDTIGAFLDDMSDSVCNYTTKLSLSDTAERDDALRLCDELDADWQASSAVSYNLKTVSLDIYCSDCERIGFLDENDEKLKLTDDGVYLCLRLKDTAEVGDCIVITPYGSDRSYTVKVAGYFRSLLSESISMSEGYADKIGLDCKITTLYTTKSGNEIADDPIISTKQEKDTVMASYDSMMDVMDMMVVLLIIAAVVLGIVVLYNLGVMSYVERRRELATLKVLGFRDKAIGRILISQNMWLTLTAVILGLPGGALMLDIIVKAFGSEYELNAQLSAVSCLISSALTFAVSLAVAAALARKNRKIDMVEALKNGE